MSTAVEVMWTKQKTIGPSAEKLYFLSQEDVGAHGE